MISEKQIAQIRHLFHAEHWKIGTIATQLDLHPLTVRAALETDRFRSQPRLRDRLVDPFLDFLRQTLQQYPRLRATRLYQMIRPRGYTGSISQLRRVVAELRPTHPEAFLRLHSFPGEMAQADWAHFGNVSIGRAAGASGGGGGGGVLGLICWALSVPAVASSPPALSELVVPSGTVGPFIVVA